MTAAPATHPRADPRTWTPPSVPRQVLVLAGRSLRSAAADRRVALLGLAQPVVLLLLFSQVFAGVSALPGVERYGGYVDFLVPATLVNVALTTAIGSGAGLLTDMYSGVLGRFRVLPIRMLSVLAARTVADVVALAVQLVAVLLTAVLVLGFRPAGGVVGTLGGFALCLLAGWGLSWMFVALCAAIPQPAALQAVGFVAIVPLMFASTAYMPADTLPGWLQVVAAVNPLTATIEGVRALVLGRPAGASVLVAVLTAVALAGLGAAWAARSMRRDGRT